MTVVTTTHITLLAIVITLMIVALLTGRLIELRKKVGEEESIDVLRKLRMQYQAEIENLRKDRETIIKDGDRAQDAIDRWELMKSDHQNLKKMREELDEFEIQESNRIDELERKRAESAARLREIQTLLDQYAPETLLDDDTWKDFINKRRKKLDKLNNKITKAEEELVELNEENTKLRSELKELEQDIEDQKNLLSTQKTKLEDMEELIAKAETELKVKKEAADAISGATIHFPEDALSVSVKEMSKDHKHSEDKLSAFRNLPECLKEFDGARTDTEATTEEEDLLKGFERALNGVGLEYSDRIIRAFHTALKVNDLSPLTVLSGLSGTGKSQLPRVYSRFFGINFLHVPVEPGWDSPQDILGFYDFVAERYRPTDRARALGHFDMRFSKEIGIDTDQVWSERLLIILLDEMNLARTEYYFSEFLSRLEMRGPRRDGRQDEDDLRNAQIAIDLPYAEGEKPKHLYVPHNVLWVGTLNEDETTQALSDKVLDRANSIRFAPPEPSTLREHSTAPETGIEASSGYLPYQRWLEWSNQKSNSNTNVEEINETLEELAKLMKDANRGLGYRITQSIKAYVDRYPGRDWRVPMIDQINMRLLPKLAGTELGDCQDVLNDLKLLCQDRLNDLEFADALENAARKSEISQTFTWPGYTY